MYYVITRRYSSYHTPVLDSHNMYTALFYDSCSIYVSVQQFTDPGT